MADLNLTPAEKNIVKYHRSSIETGNVGQDENGNPVTVYTNTIQIQDGKYAGKFVNLPGWINGEIVEDENKLSSYWADEIEKGYWPVYDSGEAADKRAKEVHQIMDDEEVEARSVLQKPSIQKRPMLMQEGIKNANE